MPPSNLQQQQHFVACAHMQVRQILCFLGWLECGTGPPRLYMLATRRATISWYKSWHAGYQGYVSHHLCSPGPKSHLHVDCGLFAAHEVDQLISCLWTQSIHHLGTQWTISLPAGQKRFVQSIRKAGPCSRCNVSSSGSSRVQRRGVCLQGALHRPPGHTWQQAASFSSSWGEGFSSPVPSRSNSRREAAFRLPCSAHDTRSDQSAWLMPLHCQRMAEALVVPDR